MKTPIKVWTEQEISYVKENFESKSFHELAETLKVTYRQIQKLINNKLNLKKRKKLTVKDGDKFERLTVVGEQYYDKECYMVHTKCSCGNEKESPVRKLLCRKEKSCGCYKAEKAAERAKLLNFIHGLKGHPIYNIWSGMKQRCYYKKHKDYHNYGGRGIIVYDKWKNNFLEFYHWALNNGWQKDLSIDRKNTNKNYEPDNCKFSTDIEQANNKRNNRLITAFEESKTVSEWSRDERCKVSQSLIIDRLNRGISPEESITRTPKRLGPKTILTQLSKDSD